MIHAEKLTFGFSSTLLFQNISFSLEENSHCALIGSNGTGKTTLMNRIREPVCHPGDRSVRHCLRLSVSGFSCFGAADERGLPADGICR